MTLRAIIPDVHPHPAVNVALALVLWPLAPLLVVPAVVELWNRATAGWVRS